jgi:hypothetical protein
VRHHAAGQELAQLAFHEPRQALAAAAQARLGQKGLEMLAHHLVQDGALGLAPAYDSSLAGGWALCALRWASPCWSGWVRCLSPYASRTAG